MNVKYKDAILGGLSVLSIALIGGGGLTMIGVVGYSIYGSVVNDIRAKYIDTRISLHFNEVCTDSFYEERGKLWFRSSLHKEGATIAIYNRWEKDGKWDECMRN